MDSFVVFRMSKRSDFLTANYSVLPEEWEDSSEFGIIQSVNWLAFLEDSKPLFTKPRGKSLPV